VFIVKGKKFYQTKRVLAPIPNERGPVTHDYVISVDTHDSHGNRYNDPEERAREVFNAAFGKTPVSLSEIDEKDVPKRSGWNEKYRFRAERFISSEMTEDDLWPTNPTPSTSQTFGRTDKR
jgi:hypothetical protein